MFVPMKMNLTELHEKAVRNVFLNVELLLNDGIRDISEYDIQSLLFLHFRRSLVHTNAHADREKEGKVDCVLFYTDEPVVFYEIKTYFKKKEKLQKSNFDHDIDKMAELLTKHPNARGYVFVAGAKSKFSKEALDDFAFVSAHLRDGKRNWRSYKLNSGETIRLRPSQKQHRGQGVVITWEVKATV